MYTLYARAGWGSALIELQLAWYGLPYRIEEVGDLLREKAAADRLRPVNPLAQVPTLVLPDGQTMTESAATTLHLAEATKRDDLVPPPPRPQFLRWLVFLVANIYPTFTYGDVPARFVPGEEAQKAFEANVNAYARHLWTVMEADAGAPWLAACHHAWRELWQPGWPGPPRPAPMAAAAARAAAQPTNRGRQPGRVPCAG